MGVLDFLFEGSPPPSTTTYGSTVENMPQWLSDYTQALIARANMVAGEGYQAYQGPRVAGFTDDQTNAFDVIRNNIGNWNDEFDTGKSATGGALTQAMPFFNQAAGATPDKVGQYMDPYVGNVIDRAKLEAGRTWDEKIMPGIESRFITSGQSGSSGHRVGLERAGRDVTEGLHSQSLAALSDAYKTAGSQYQTDASRIAGIGQNVGQLGLQTGSQMAGLAQLQQQLTGRDASSLSMVGDAQQQQTQRNLDTAYGDFQQQRDYPRQNVDWMSSIIRGMPHDTTTSTSGTGPANAYQPSPLSQLISLYGLYKDVTDKAQGGLVEYGKGGKVSGARGAIDMLKRLTNNYEAMPAQFHPKDDDEAFGIILQADREGLSAAEWRRRIAAQNKPVKKAHGGAVRHIPGPLEGYGRYAEGGEVSLEDKEDALRILREMSDRLDGYPRRRRSESVKMAGFAHGGLACLER